VVIYL